MTQNNPISTQIAQTGQTPTLLSGAKTGVFAGGAGGNFWDVILGLTADAQNLIQISGKKTDADAAVKTQAELDAEIDAAFEAELDLILASLSDVGTGEDIVSVDAAGQTPPVTEKPLTLQELVVLLKAQDENIPVEFQQFRAERIQKKIDGVNDLLERLTHGLPEDLKGKPFVEFFITRLEHKLDTLELRLDELEAGDGENFEALIALGLTPLQITDALKKIDITEEKLGRELTAEDLIAGVGGIVPPPKPIVSALRANDEPTDDLAAAFNDIDVGGPADSALPLDRRTARIIELLQKYEGNVNAGADVFKGGQVSNPAIGAFLASQNIPGDVNLPKGWYQAYFDRAAPGAFDIHAGFPLSAAAQAVHASTAIPQAGQPHPATQLVAAHLSKAAKDGSPQSITIELDPPELGRVDVRLEFGPDKTVSAVLTIEKPETHLMFQRDAAFLERALHSAGLSVDSGGLSFELASDPGAFDKGEGQGGGQGNGQGGEPGTDERAIETTTMTWQVDQETGHVRYNLFA